MVGRGGPFLRVLLEWVQQSSLTLLLFLLFLLVYLVLHNTAELGLAGALSLADGLQQRDLATGRVHHFLGSSLDWEERLLRQG